MADGMGFQTPEVFADKDTLLSEAFARIDAEWGPSRRVAPYQGSLEGLQDSIAAAGRYRLRGEDR